MKHEFSANSPDCERGPMARGPTAGIGEIAPGEGKVLDRQDWGGSAAGHDMAARAELAQFGHSTPRQITELTVALS